MGNATCDECGKKFKVFAKRRKCMHCMTIVCKKCLVSHTKAKHPGVVLAQSAAFNLQLEEHEERHFLSPINSPSTERSDQDLHDAFMDGMEDVEMIESDDDEEEDEDDEDPQPCEHDDLLLGPFSRRSSAEEEQKQYGQFLQMQQAITTWTKKELNVKQHEQQLLKRKSCYAMTPVPNIQSTRQQQQRRLLATSYTVFVTLVVWGAYAALWTGYQRIRDGALVVGSF